jgi:hypothetical protein
MPLTLNGVSASALAELLGIHLKTRSLEYFAASAPSPEATKRRVFDILNGRVQMVSLRVADELCTLAGRPDWLQLL